VVFHFESADWKRVKVENRQSPSEMIDKRALIFIFSVLLGAFIVIWLMLAFG